MQTSVSGKQRILPEMSRALHLESGIVGKRRLSFADDAVSAIVSAVFLAVFLYGISV